MYDCDDCRHKGREFDQQPCFSCLPPNEDKWERKSTDPALSRVLATALDKASVTEPGEDQ